MYYSGIRIGEALALQWKDFDFERRYFLVYKAVSREYEIDEYGHKIGTSRNIVKSTKSAAGIRPLALLDVEYEALMEWKEYMAAQERVKGIPYTDSESYIFANDDGELRSEWGTNSMFQRFRKRHNLEGKRIFQLVRCLFEVGTVNAVIRFYRCRYVLMSQQLLYDFRILMRLE